MIVYENETAVISLNVSSNVTAESVSFEPNFGPADRFCSFDPMSTEVEIVADSISVGTHTLEMVMTYGTNTYSRTMLLTVLTLLTEVTEVEEPGDENNIFIDLEAPIQVRVAAQIQFVVDDYFTQGIGTVFDSVELLQLSDFVEFNNRTITIQPVLEQQIGEYPFILRVFDVDNLPFS